jgi:hypothetical protein
MALIFGYGSLVTNPGLRPATVAGHRRTWGVAMDNTVDLPAYKHYEQPGTGARPALMVAFLDLERVDGGETAAPVNGAVFEALDLAALDARERNYERVEIETSAGPAFTYTGSAEGRERLARGVAEDRVVVQRAYLMRVLAGFAALGADGLDGFEATTGPLPGPLADLVLVPHR